MRILVIRLKQIGDALLSLPVCSSLKRTFPSAHVDYALYEHIAPLFLNHPDINRLVAVTAAERANALRFMDRILWIRRRRYDLVLDLLATPTSAVMTLLAGAPRTIGFDHHPWRARLYRTRVPHPMRGDTVDRKLAILAGLGQPVIVERQFRIWLTAAETGGMRERMEAAGIDFARPVIAFAVTSRREYKVWPPAYMAEVIDACVAGADAQAVLFQGPGEAAQVERVRARLQSRSGVFNNVETRDIRELAALIANCDLFAGNEGGPRHIAQALDVPALAIFSPAVHAGVWLPDPSPRNQAVTIADALGLEAAEYDRRFAEFARHPQQFYPQVRPALVIPRILAMLAAVTRFAGPAPSPPR